MMERKEMNDHFFFGQKANNQHCFVSEDGYQGVMVLLLL
jgi:hypothetical protein